MCCMGSVWFNRVPCGPQEAEAQEDKGGDGDDGKEHGRKRQPVERVIRIGERHSATSTP